MSSSSHLVVGAGPIGSEVARQLADAGHQVRIATRSGSGPVHESVERVVVDASDASKLSELARGSAVIYNCVNPPYHRWPQEWPPIAAALLAAAQSSGAVLSTCSNLYMYGPTAKSMVETDPMSAPGAKGKVRAQMWRDALAAHVAGRVRVTEARGSDYVGPGVQAHLGDRIVPKILAGKKKLSVLGNPDVQHTWTYAPDMAATLIAIGSDERAWGRPWHVPSDLSASQRDVIAAMAQAAGLLAPAVSQLPWAVISTLGLVMPMMREIKETAYQVDEPFIMDSTAARTELGLGSTPPETVIAETVQWYAEKPR